MANIVFLSVPAFGHLNPVLPIVAELVRRGHTVTVYDEPPFQTLIEATGAGFVAYPPAMSMEDMAAVLMGGDLVATFALFLRATPALVRFCRPRLKANRPDVLVYDGIALWGEVLGKMLKLPTVVASPFFAYEIPFAGGRSPEFWQMARSMVRNIPLMAWQWIRVALLDLRAIPLHLPFLPASGKKMLMLTSRELHPKSPTFSKPRWVFAGAQIDPRTRLDRFDFSRLDDRPVIYVSLGTLIFAKTNFYERCIEALADYPGQVLLSAGRGSDLSRFKNAPANFIIEETFPQLDVLQRAAMFITPCGLNSLHEALWFGVPMVAIPQHFEQLHNAQAMAAGGAGITLDAEVYGGIVSPDALRRAVETVAAGLSGYRAKATALGQSLRDAGGVAEAVRQIEMMVPA